MNQANFHRLHYLRRSKKEFIREDVEAIYNIQSSSAKLWIKSWMDEGQIKIQGTTKTMSYTFI